MFTNLRFHTTSSRVHPKIANVDSKKKKEMQISSCSETEETRVEHLEGKTSVYMDGAYQIVGWGY